MNKRIFKTIITIIHIFFFLICSVYTYADEQLDYDISYENFIINMDSQVLEQYDNYDLDCDQDNGYYAISMNKNYEINYQDEDYFFDGIVCMNYKLEYYKNENIFTLEASTTDSLGNPYYSKYVGVAFINEYNQMDILFTDGFNYCTLSELEAVLDISLYELVIALTTYEIAMICLMVACVVAIAATTTNSGHSSGIPARSSVSNAINGLNENGSSLSISNAFNVSLIYSSYTLAISTVLALKKLVLINKMAHENSTINSLGSDIYDLYSLPSVKKRMRELESSENELNGIIDHFLDYCELEYSDLDDYDDKILCIGRDLTPIPNNDGIEEISLINNYIGTILSYNNFALMTGYVCFYATDYNTYMQNDSRKQDKIDFANQLLIMYCIDNDWDFMLLTEPYFYLVENYTGRYKGEAYKNEIELIRKHDYNNFLNDNITWESILNMNLADDFINYYSFTSYRVSR